MLAKKTDWFQKSVIYQLHVRSFADGDDDGVGDFKGLVSRLEYLSRLGVDALWLQPFYPSPLRDDGYDIADYYAINPDYGTLRDFKYFLREAHKRNLRVITDLVLNHTSDQHPWFQRSRRAAPGSKWRDYYVWSETPDKYPEARIIFKDLENSNWAWDPVAKAYYWHRFFSHQPDLNYDNPAVRREMLKIVNYWLGMGVDGFRLDAVTYLYEREGTNCESLPETHAFLRELRRHMDTAYPDSILLAEANQWPEDAVHYFGQGDECHMAFHFPIMPRIFMSVWHEDRYPIVDILEQTPPIPERCQWALFLRNHDELTLEMVSDEERDAMYRGYAPDDNARLNLGIRRRLAPLMQNNRRKLELINFLLFSFPGSPIVYYGDELGMGDNYHLGDRNGVRTPMQWCPDRNAGFSKANPQSLFLPVVIDPEYHYEVVNAETQERNQSSFLWWMRRLIAAYKAHPALGGGAVDFVRCVNSKVLALLRSYGEERILVVANLSRRSQIAELQLEELAGAKPVEIFGQTVFPTIGRAPYVFTLGPYCHFWLRLESPAPPLAVSAPLKSPLLAGRKAAELCAGEELRVLGVEALSPLLERRLAVQGQDRFTLPKVIDEHAFSCEGAAASLVLTESVQPHGPALMNFLLLARADAHSLLAQDNVSVIANLDCPQGKSLLLDGTSSSQLVASFAAYLSNARCCRSAAGTFFFENGSARIHRKQQEQPFTHVRTISRTAYATTFTIDNKLFLKIFLRPEEGQNPDLIVPRHLERLGFTGVARQLTSLEYRRGRGQPMALAVVSECLDGAACETYVRDELDRYVEAALASRTEPPSWRKADETAWTAIDSEQVSMIGEYSLDFFRRLGRRVAELHAALSGVENPQFRPEPITKHYLRSVYQAMRGQAHQAVQALENVRRTASGVEGLAMRAVLERLGGILNIIPAGVRIRIHGDCQFDNILYRQSDFFFTDFDGDPRLPLSERCIKRSPLRDVASLLWSLSLASEKGLARHLARHPTEERRLTACVSFWRSCVSRTLLASYAASESGLIWADHEARAVMLEAYTLEQGLRSILRCLEEAPQDLTFVLSLVVRLVNGN